MARRGRPPGFQMSEEHRSKIKSAQILNALQEHVMGDREMSATQISAGLGLLRKVLPDLSSEDVNIKGGGPLVIQLVRFADVDRSDPK
jgi:hypothetical protein